MSHHDHQPGLGQAALAGALAALTLAGWPLSARAHGVDSSCEAHEAVADRLQGSPCAPNDGWRGVAAGPVQGAVKATRSTW